jgi:hypothetical protein
MIAKKTLIHISLIAFILVITVAGFGREDLVQSQWAVQPVTIDGQDNDWSGVELTSEKKVKVDYAVRNDAENMYVLFIFKDPAYLSTINHTGITMYFNTEGKKKKDEGFHFIQKQVGPEELIAYLKRRGQVLTEQQIQSIKSKPGYVVFMAERLTEDDEETVQAVSTSEAMVPGFKISRKDKTFTFEFRVPLVRSEASPEGIGVKPGESLKIGFEWGGMTKELAKKIQAGGDISEESRAGGVIDSRRTIGGAPTSASRNMPKKYDFWCDVKLAQSQ